MDENKITNPTVRIRVAHTHTLKEGWRLSETTVEWTGSFADFENTYGDDVADALRESFGRGTAETNLRRDEEATRYVEVKAG